MSLEAFSQQYPPVRETAEYLAGEKERLKKIGPLPMYFASKLKTAASDSLRSLSDKIVADVGQEGPDAANALVQVGQTEINLVHFASSIQSFYAMLGDGLFSVREYNALINEGFTGTTITRINYSDFEDERISPEKLSILRARAIEDPSLSFMFQQPFEHIPEVYKKIAGGTSGLLVLREISGTYYEPTAKILANYEREARQVVLKQDEETPVGDDAPFSLDAIDRLIQRFDIPIRNKRDNEEYFRSIPVPPGIKNSFRD